MKTAFDEYGESYDNVMKQSIGFAGQYHDYYTQAKVACILDVLQRRSGDPKNLRVLDVGCGVGKTDRFLAPSLGTLCGVDISSASIERARRENPQVQYEMYDGHTLPFADETFDAAFLICVLHHVLPAERLKLLKETRRALKPGGVLFIFEHNPYNPLTRLAVARCEFDRDAQLISRPLARQLLEETGVPMFEQRYILISPFPIKGMAWIERSCRQIPLGAQYYVAGQKPNG